MLGKCLYEGMLLELPLAAFFLKKMRGGVCDINDMPSLDPEVYKHLLQLRHYQGMGRGPNSLPWQGHSSLQTTLQYALSSLASATLTLCPVLHHSNIPAYDGVCSWAVVCVQMTTRSCR
jgi:hypothetical protein